MKNTCAFSYLRAGEVNVLGKISLHIVGHITLINICLTATGYISIIVDHAHPFMTTIFKLLIATSSMVVITMMKMMMRHVTKSLKVFETGLMSMNNTFSVLQWPCQSRDLNTLLQLECTAIVYIVYNL